MALKADYVAKLYENVSTEKDLWIR